ncbi:hypothetical protein EMPG_11713 [Blastomyces silverae]|uniref:Uncharacterized protein n=1 Tax=Blastomyces silverae TaxID=2060906 RepID=A0A0H1BQH0_9EURO|nr:hypothetical protein EMPG_11713 [Blastomyces silverae]
MDGRELPIRQRPQFEALKTAQWPRQLAPRAESARATGKPSTWVQIKPEEYVHFTEPTIAYKDVVEGSLPPLYRLLANEQCRVLLKAAEDKAIPVKMLGSFWPGDFDSDGKIRCNRVEWEVDDGQPRTNVMKWCSNASGERRMKTCPQSIKEAHASAQAQEGTYRHLH